jgi:hypothetical protein
MKYRIGVPSAGSWREVLNSDDRRYYGSGQGNRRVMKAAKVPMHGHAQSLALTVPPLGVIFLKRASCKIPLNLSGIGGRIPIIAYIYDHIPQNWSNTP